MGQWGIRNGIFSIMGKNYDGSRKIAHFHGDLKRLKPVEGWGDRQCPIPPTPLGQGGLSIAACLAYRDVPIQNRRYTN
jgi:hypothetical protein